MPNERQPTPPGLVRLRWDDAQGKLIFEPLSAADVNAAPETHLVVVIRVEDCPVPAEPARRDVCMRCGAAVWIGPSTVAALTGLDRPQVVCLPCAGLLDHTHE